MAVVTNGTNGTNGEMSRLSRGEKGQGDSPFRGLSPVPPDSGELFELARRVRRLTPSSRDPEWFHLEKSEIEAALRSIARRVLPPSTGCGPKRHVSLLDKTISRT